MNCFTSILYCNWETEAQKGIGLGLRCPAAVGLKNNTIRIDSVFLLMLLQGTKLYQGENECFISSQREH